MLEVPAHAAQRSLGVLESDSIELTSNDKDEIDVLTAVGPLPGVALWFQGPSGWRGSSEEVTVRLYARIAGLRVLLAKARLADVESTQDGDDIHALLLSCQGIHAEAFEVTVQRASGGAQLLSSGVFVLSAPSQGSPLSLAIAGGLDASQGVHVTAPVIVVQSTASLLQATVAQGVASSQGNRWPVFLSDGSAERGTSSSPLSVHPTDERAAYAASVDVNSGTAAATKLLFHLWHPSTSSKRFEIRRVLVSVYGGVTGSPRLTLRGNRITSSAGQTTVTPERFDPDDAASTAVVRKDPSSSSSTNSTVDLFAFAIPGTQNEVFVWEAAARGRPIVLLANKDGGFEIRSTLGGTLGTAAQILISVEWLEV
jgi:hypothetical protein